MSALSRSVSFRIFTLILKCVDASRHCTGDEQLVLTLFNARGQGLLSSFFSGAGNQLLSYPVELFSNLATADPTAAAGFVHACVHRSEVSCVEHKEVSLKHAAEL